MHAHEQAARDHRAAVAGIVGLQYEATSRRLRAEGDARAGSDRDARDEAIRRLEADGDPSPQGLLDLAALLEARARDGDAEGLAARLGPAIAALERFVHALPDHPQTARAVHALGRLRHDAGREAEAQQAFRSLVCHDRFPLDGAAPLPADPYPIACRPLGGIAEEALVAEAWRLIGDAHLAREDPVDLAHAEAAYRNALTSGIATVRPAARLGLAAVLSRRGFADAALRTLLGAFQEAEKREGTPATSLHAEILAAIAEALDTQPPPAHGAKKKPPPHPGIARAQDPALVPQDQRWTAAIYDALAARYEAQGELRSAADVMVLGLQKWPAPPESLFRREHLAELYDGLAARAPEGSPERETLQEKAIDTRLKLGSDLGASFDSFHRVDPSDLAAAEIVVRRSLHHAAADRHNGAIALVDRALGIHDEAPRNAVLERALAGYRHAAELWQGYLAQDENAADVDETRFWLAEARYGAIAAEVVIGRVPSPASVEAAEEAAARARDAARDGDRLQRTAQLSVAVAERALEAQQKLFARTSGKEGVEKLDRIKTTGEGEDIRIVSTPLAPAELAVVAARDAYIERVPAAADYAHNALDLATASADLFFLHGQFDEARKRWTPIYKERCGKHVLGYRAWERLMMMANLEMNIAESRRLAEEDLQHPCGATLDPPIPSPWNPPHPGPPYGDPYAAFQRAEREPEGPARVRAMRLAAELYQRALEEAPARDEAPEAAMNGAYAFKQAGNFNAAIEMYQLFLREYGHEDLLIRLEKGDPATTPPRPPDPRRYTEHLQYTKQAWDALGAAQVMSFDYAGAAATYAQIAAIPRYKQSDRRDAARNAVILFAKLGDKPALVAARAAYLGLKPSKSDKAELEKLLAPAKPTKKSAPAPRSGEILAPPLPVVP